MDVSWDSSLAIKGGSGKVHIWSLATYSGTEASGTIVGAPCGSVLPEITTSALAGSKKVLPEIPDAAWDHANMPRFPGTVTTTDGVQKIDPGIALVGLTMANPSATWPSATSITGADHDGDSKPGVTAIPREGNGFSAPPTSIQQNKFVDRLYLATRNVMTLEASDVEACPDVITGKATVTKFDSHVIGCHVKGGGECNATEAKFVDDNRTVYEVGSATFTTKMMPDAATCADVRAALPMQ